MLATPLRRVLLGFCAAVAVTAAQAGAAQAAGGLTWTKPASIDTTGSLQAVACGTQSLCVAVDHSGHALITTDADAEAPAWSAPATVDGARSLLGVSCVLSEFCVAVDELGDAVTTTEPSAEDPAWSNPANIDGFIPTSISCASTALCAEAGAAGTIAITDDPTAPTPVWTSAKIDSTIVLNSISCPSTSLCVAVDAEGHALTTTDPTEASPTWSGPADIDSTNFLTGVSCASASLCVAVDHAGNALISRDPSNASPAWTTLAGIDTKSPDGVSCAPGPLCVAVDIEGNAVLTTDAASEAPTWSMPSAIDEGEYLAAVACPVATLCVAVGGSHAVFGHLDSPANVTPPTLSGHAVEGRTLAATSGSWSGSPGVFEYQWQRCKASCVNVAGAVGHTYTLTNADIGARIRVVVTAFNGAGGSPSSSNELGPVLPSVAHLKASLQRQIVPHGKAARIRSLRRTHAYPMPFVSLSGGRLAVDWYLLPKGGRLAAAASRPVLVAAGTATFAGARVVKVEVRLTAAGKRLFAKSSRRTLTVRAKLMPHGEAAVVAQARFTPEP